MIEVSHSGNMVYEPPHRPYRASVAEGRRYITTFSWGYLQLLKVRAPHIPSIYRMHMFVPVEFRTILYLGGA